MKIIRRFEKQIHYRGSVEQWNIDFDATHYRLDAFIGGLPPHGMFLDTFLQYGCDWLMPSDLKANAELNEHHIKLAKSQIRRGLYPVLKSVERYRKRALRSP